MEEKISYYEPEFDLNGTTEELYMQARNGYIENPDALHRLAEIMELEGKKELAERVMFMEEREREGGKNTQLYSIAQLKIDYMDRTGGIDNLEIGEGFNLTVQFEHSNDTVNVYLSHSWIDGNENVLSVGTASLHFDEFKQMNQSDFEQFINEVNAYSMAEQERIPIIEKEQQRSNEEYQRWGNPEFYRIFYDYDHIQASTYATEMNYHMFWGGEQQGLNGGSYVVYRDIADLPKYLREYAAEQERKDKQNTNYIQQTKTENEGIEQTKEKKDAKELLTEQLKTGINNILNSDTYKNWLDTSSRLYHKNYSFNNAILVFMQKPEASYIMGYDAWKDYGRSVRQGAKGAKIFVPVMAYDKTQGSLFRMIISSLREQLKENPDKIAEYQVGASRLSFMMNRNGQMSYCIDGEEKGIFENQQQVQKFIQNAVLGKVPMYFTVGTVFDVKDTVIPEYLWVKKGYTKNEIVKGEDGKAIKNKRGEVKIYNTPERQAKFNTTLNMTVKEKPKEQMEKLYDALKATCERNGIHVYEREREQDENLQEADGYFSRQINEENPRGYIVMPTDLEPTRKVSVLMHEAAHSDLHGNLEQLAESMGEKKIPLHMREIQAESVAYAVARHFGIETDTSSFKYLAIYSKGFKLQDLHKSMEVIYRECKKMTQELEAELDARGLTIELEEKESEPIQKESIARLSEQYIKYALGESDNISSILAEIPKIAIDNRNNADLLDIIKEQKYCTERQESAINLIYETVEKLQVADTRVEQDLIISQIEAVKRRMESEKEKFTGLSQSFMTIASQEKKSLREAFFQNPKKTIEIMKKDYPKLRELSGMQLDYVYKSYYIKDVAAHFLKGDPDKFVDEVYKRAESLDNVISKNGCFVEINNCEQWTDKPIVKIGAIMHPKVANDIIKQGEIQILGLKREAEKNETYFPYAKCNLTVFAPNRDKCFIAYQIDMEIGNGNQNSLTDYICRECKDKNIFANFDKATREKGAKEKIMFHNVSEQPEKKENWEEKGETFVLWENSIREEKTGKNYSDGQEKKQGKEKDDPIKENR